MTGLGIGINLAVGGGSSRGISLSNRTFPAGSAQATAIGSLSVIGGVGTYTFTLTDSASNKAQVAGANGVNLQAGSASASAGSFDVTVHADNGAGSTFDKTFPILAWSSVSNSVAPAITGSAKQGVTLSVSDGTWAGLPAPSFAYQWKRAGTPISGAVTSTYTLQAADVGSAITCTVTASNGFSNANATSSATPSVTKTTLSYSPVTSATTGVAYTGATPSTSNGTSPYAYSVSGSLPAGLSLNGSTGVISGTPTTMQTASGLVLVATDANGVTDSSSPFSIAVTDPGVLPAPTLDLVAGSDSGSSSTDNITSDTTPDIQLTPGAGATFLQNDVLTAYVDSVAQTPYTVTAADEIAQDAAINLSALSQGVRSIEFTHGRSGYTTSPKSSALAITIDTTAPTISTASTANCAENATLAITLAANETVAWSITGGADQARFEISGTTLRWASNGTKNFESPNDADTNNTYIVQVTATDPAGNATNKTITVTVTDVAAPSLSSASGAQLAQTTASLSVATNGADGTLYYVVTTSATPPSAAQVKAGQNNGGSAALYAGSQAISSTGTKTATATGVTNGTRYAYFMHENAAGEQSSVASSSSWSQVDVTAPVLSNATDTKTGSTTATITVDTDEGNGTLYYVLSSAITAPTAAQIIAGNDHTGSAALKSGNASVSGTGTQTINVTSLTASTTYYAHFAQKDAANNTSNVASGNGLTTDAAPSGPYAIAASIIDMAFGASPAVFSGVVVNNSATSDLIVIEVSSSHNRIIGVTIDDGGGAVAMTLVVESNAGTGTSIWKYTGKIFTNATVRVSSATNLAFVGVSGHVLPGVNTTETDTAIKAFGTSADPQVTTSQLDIPASGYGVAVYGEAGVSSGVTWNTGSEDTDINSAGNHGHSSAHFTTSATPSLNGSDFAGQSMAAAAWGP